LRLNVAAEAHYEVVNGARVRIFMEIPNVLQDSFARNWPAAIAYEVAQKLCFHERELEHLAAAAQLKVGEIYGPIIEMENVGRFLFRNGLGLSGADVAQPILTALEAFHSC